METSSKQRNHCKAYLHVFRKIEELPGVKLKIDVMNADMESALASALRQWNPNVKIVYCQDPGSKEDLDFSISEIFVSKRHFDLTKVHVIRAWATRAKRYRIYEDFRKIDILKKFWKAVKGSVNLPMHSDIFALAYRNFFDETIGQLADYEALPDFKKYVDYLLRSVIIVGEIIFIW